jgi:hypothetical protein
MAPPPQDNAVLQWNAAVLQGVRESKLGPPMVARALAIVHTAVYDAWAAYDDTAVATQLGAGLRRPLHERTPASKREALSYAAYRAASDLFPASAAHVFAPLMTSLGYDPADTRLDPHVPSGIGNLSAAVLLDSRHRDGANQLGDEPGGTAGVAYADYTGYRPANDPMVMSAPFDPATVHDPSRWQPLVYTDAAGNLTTQPFVGAQWGRVRTFALGDPARHQPAGAPAAYGSDAYRAQALELLAISASLTDEQKMIAEYWADGPHSELPPGHWNLFAQYVSRRDRHTLDDDVRLFFALTNAVADAAVCCWYGKRAHDSVRPVTAIRVLFAGQTVQAWAGPGQGTKPIAGETWIPYQPPSFPTPPFPEYTSGHSTFSAAAAEVLRLATGSERFGASVTFAPGSSRVEPGAVPSAPVTLLWATFGRASDQAGLSRRYGGIHFRDGDLRGRAAGRTVGQLAWARAQRLFAGAA